MERPEELGGGREGTPPAPVQRAPFDLPIIKNIYTYIRASGDSVEQTFLCAIVSCRVGNWLVVYAGFMIKFSP